ncbi:agamous-like MADS-box protein AGL62 [Euphorbia lathyris]|uniref:agamous-like MADS-box protein AGL62 n=1 Tax=Euphorbia lathyris TaxID=212925 RepID=UPI00331406FA
MLINQNGMPIKFSNYANIHDKRKKTRGRQKVPMVKMANENNLQVTFSKRRAGLFNKAIELSTLCGAEIGIIDVRIIVFSPGKKVFSFGHPSIETVIDRYLSGNNQAHPSPTMQLIESHRNANIRDLNNQLTQVMNQLEMEKKRGEELKRIRNLSSDKFWWEKPIDELDLAQLQLLKASMEDLRQNVTNMIRIQNSEARLQFLGLSSNQAIAMSSFGINNEVFNPDRIMNNHGQGFNNHSQGFNNPGFNNHSRGFNNHCHSL